MSALKAIQTISAPAHISINPDRLPEMSELIYDYLRASHEELLSSKLLRYLIDKDSDFRRRFVVLINDKLEQKIPENTECKAYNEDNRIDLKLVFNSDHEIRIENKFTANLQADFPESYQGTPRVPDKNIFLLAKKSYLDAEFSRRQISKQTVNFSMISWEDVISILGQSEAPIGGRPTTNDFLGAVRGALCRLASVSTNTYLDKAKLTSLYLCNDEGFLGKDVLHTIAQGIFPEPKWCVSNSSTPSGKSYYGFGRIWTTLLPNGPQKRVNRHDSRLYLALVNIQGETKMVIDTLTDVPNFNDRFSPLKINGFNHTWELPRIESNGNDNLACWKAVRKVMDQVVSGYTTHFLP